ncbi:MAG: GNAT family N-acetyltransferase [Lachnospiraceae bacterium]|nr:GNAT family N-acetyltransferase [Lachnospiraceae bacterium]
MVVREASGKDAQDLKVLYFEYLTKYPPQEEQNMEVWEAILEEYSKDKYNYILVAEEDGKAVASVQMAIIRSLTHNVRPFAVIENVVTHEAYRQRGFASALLERATEIAVSHNCYKVSLETGSNREYTLNFYRNNGFAIDEKHSCLNRL